MKNNVCNINDIDKMEHAFNLIQKTIEDIEVKKLQKINAQKIGLLQDKLLNFEVRFP